MRATLIHNPTAGYDEYQREDILELLCAEGYEATYQPTDDDNWEKALAEPGELVVVAGGDGTVDKVAANFRKRGIPLGILPLGTANNIARQFSIRGSIAEIIASWKTARRQKVDLGVAKGPWGKMYFVEAIGVGAFAQMMPILDALGKQQSHRTSEEHLNHDLTNFNALIDACRASSWEIKLDNKRIDGEFLMLEIMNISTVGPGLQLAPTADPSDGLLDVVLIEKEHREELKNYLAQCQITERPAATFSVRRAKDIQFVWEGSMIHVDSTLWSSSEDRLKKVKSPKKAPPFTIDIYLEPNELEILVPRE